MRIEIQKLTDEYKPVVDETEARIVVDTKSCPVVLTEVFNGVIIRTEEGIEFGIAQRDNGIEVVRVTGEPGGEMVCSIEQSLGGAGVSYDSRPDTRKHITQVRVLLSEVTAEFIERGRIHDASKLEEPELSVFNEYTPKLKEQEYGSDEYKQSVKEMTAKGLDHHYANNRHHPEFFGATGIHGMNLLDLIEMLADWKAAGLRHSDGGNLRHSIKINRDRFGYNDAMAELLLSTAEFLEWL